MVGAAADVVLLDANIWTGWSERPRASALAISDGTLSAVGDAADVLPLVDGRTRVMRLGGLSVIPGLSDIHTHCGEVLRYNRALEKANTRDELLGLLKSHLDTLPADQWAYVGFTLSRPDWWLRRTDLDAVSGGRPLFMSMSGHVYAANSRALALANVSRDTPDPFGGSLERDPSGEPTGLLFDTARFLVLDAMPKRARPDQSKSLLAAQQQLSEIGITTVHDMVMQGSTVAAYQRLRLNGELRCRTVLLLRGYESSIALKSIAETGIGPGFGDDRLRIGGVKFSLDGQFPSRGALYSEPYRGENQGCGVLRIPPDEFGELVRAAHDAGMQICVHAVGERAVHMTLDAFEAVDREGSVAARRHRIEHCGNVACDPATRARLARLGAIAVPNPPSLYFRGVLAEPYLGPPRSNYVCNVGDLLREGVRVAVASDWPGLGSMNPFLGMYTLVTRRTQTDQCLQLEQAVSVEQALRLYTAHAAFAEFAEDRKGSLQPGKLGDLVILPEDITAIASERLAQVRPLATLVGGEVVFQASEFSTEAVSA